MYDIKLIKGKLRRWEKFMKKYSFPAYNDIPDLGLYMDQVLTLMNQYLAPLTTEDSENGAITAAAINNYVRMKVMPAPEKKKYGRIHIAYLIIICTLKQAISISDIQKLIPGDLSEKDMRELYDIYAKCYKGSTLFFINEVKEEVDHVLNSVEGDVSQADFDATVKMLIFSSATIANFAKLLTSKVVALGDVEFSEEAVADREC